MENHIKAILTAIISVSLCMIGACSQKGPPPPQPPVVINLNNARPPARQGEAKLKEGEKTGTAPYRQAAKPPAVVNPDLQQGVLPATGSNQPKQTITEKMDEASFLNTQVHEMALQLLKNFSGEPGPEGPVAVATFVDLNSLYRTSPFGRYIAEQLIGELQRAGFQVVEIRKTNSIMIKQKFGEYGLSRDIQEIARDSSARYVLTGTYIARGNYIMVNARLISNDNNMVASSCMKILRRDPLLDRMLWPSASPRVNPAIRVPIKELGSLGGEVRIMPES